MECRQLLLLASSLLFCGSASADSDFYLQIKLGGSAQKYEVYSSESERVISLEDDEKDGVAQSRSLLFGYRLSQSLSLELSYTDNGLIENTREFSYPTTISVDGITLVLPAEFDQVYTYYENVQLTSWNFGLKYQHPISDELSLYTSGGLTRWRFDDYVPSLHGQYGIEEEGLSWYLGAGASYKLAPQWSLGVGADFSVASAEYEGSLPLENEYRHYLLGLSAFLEHQF